MKKKLNSIFSPCDDESKDLESIIFNTPTTYNNKVKTHNWQIQTLAEPRDNVDIFPPKGNLHKSSYRRLGSRDPTTGMSETQAMLTQIELKDQYQQIYPQRSLFNVRSIISSVKEEGPRDLTLTDVLIDPDEVRRMDYRTTMETDYRLFCPIKPRPPPPVPPPEPWLLNRRTIGYGLRELEKRNGIHTFLDDNMELHQSIADLKMRRNNLNDTILKNNLPPNLEGVSKMKKEPSNICH